jgi:soluble lytic murein transglycosylase-like protein
VPWEYSLKSGKRTVLVAAAISVAMIWADAAKAAPAQQMQSSARIYAADRIASFVAEAAQHFGIPPGWIRAVMHVESGGDLHAVSPKGAMGLMQIMPKTYAGLRLRHGLGRNPYDPHDNILAGAAYLREMHDLYGSAGFLAAYNAGPDRYEDHLATGRALPLETRAYVATLNSMLGLKQFDGNPRVKFAAADPMSWTHGPLFIVQEVMSQLTAITSSPRSDSQSPESLPVRPSNTRSVADVTALVPQSHGLFVHRSSNEATP